MAPFLITFWVVLLGGTYAFALAWWFRRRRLLQRLDLADEADAGTDLEDAGFLARWLLRAGFRSRDATIVFLVANALALATGAVVGYWLAHSSLLEQMRLTTM